MSSVEPSSSPVAGMPPAALDEQSLLAEAESITGLSDFGEPSFREGLRRLLDSLEREARLTPLGRYIARAQLVRHLENRLRVAEDWKRHPEMGREKIVRPLFVVGLPRTGSTILHDLLAQDPDNRVPLTWECDRPSPPPERATYETDPRIAEVDAILAQESGTYIPEFKAIHFMGARVPQECVMLQAFDFTSVIFANQFRIPSYEAWVENTDLRAVYATHRRQLQYMQWRCPGVRWVLKSTGHLWGLGALFETYPDAMIVQTHRDPLKFLSSHASLVCVARRMESDEVEPREVGLEWSNSWEDALRKGMAFRASGRIPEERFFDVRYADFMRDPIAMVRKVYAHFDLDLGREAEARMRSFLGDNPQGKHGEHRYAPEQFGLDLATVRERFRFYTEHFQVAPEGAE